ncbi:hypothetical protein JK158_13180 [Enterobacter sp. JGM127]|nr:hypothetical protein [Enterobacter sp. JGM127]
MTLTKEEQIQAIYDLKVGYTLGHADIAILKSMARQLLASMEQEPIAWLNDAYLGRGVVDGEAGSEDAGPGYIPVYREPTYTAPPAAVSVFDIDHESSLIKHVKKVAHGISSTPALVAPDELDLLTCHLDGVTETYAEGWNSCRSAMLQGGDGNSPVIPDGYALLPIEPTKEMIDAGWSYYMTTKSPSSIGVYGAMLAAAPQQEAE